MSPPDESERLHQPKPGEAQLSLRAVASGCALGGVVAASNVYIGLRLGWTVGGSLLAALLGFALFRALKPAVPYTVLEATITQTTGSSAAVMVSTAGLIAPIPAMAMLGQPVSPGALFLWAASVALLGACSAVPLRRYYVVEEKLRFPMGTATARTIVAMFDQAAEAAAQGRALLWFAVGAAVFNLAGYVYPPILQPPVMAWLGLAALAKWTFVPYLSPMMVGTGLLVGPRVGVSMLAGGILAWGVLGPLAHQQGWAAGPIMSSTSGPRGWIVWAGVAVMVAEALTALALSWRSFVHTLTRTRPGASQEDEGHEIPRRWWLLGLAVASGATVLSAWWLFGISPLLSLVALALTVVLANVAVRSTGETDVNPAGPVAKVTQLIHGALAPGAASTGIMAAAITSAGATQAGDMMQDLKTGHLLGASPRKQFIAQLWGVGAGVLLCVPVYLLFDHAYDIGQGELSAPAAKGWSAVALVLSKGLAAFPPKAEWAALSGVAVGVVLPLIRRWVPRLAPYVPSGLALGIAFLIPAYASIAISAGSILLWLWSRRSAEHRERFAYVVACGLIVGEALMGIGNAVMKIAGVPSFGG